MSVERRLRFKASDRTYHSIPEKYLWMAREIDPGLTVLDTYAANPWEKFQLVESEWACRCEFTEHDARLLKGLGVSWEGGS
jgi:hypothetical protein